MAERPLRLLHDTLIASAARAPEKTALITQDGSLSYRALLDGSRRLAGALRDRGVQRGDRVAIFLENGVECVQAIYAAGLAGAVFVVINPQTKRDKLTAILNDSGATCLVTDGQLARVFVPAVDGVLGLRAIICSGRLPVTSATSVAFADALAGSEPAEPCRATIPIDLAALIYTSGSTGQPKGVMMTHQSMVFTAGSLVEYLRLSADQRILNVLPLAFDYGLYQLLMSVYLGATLVLERSFTYPAPVLARMSEHAVSVLPGVPTIYSMLVSMHRNSALSFPTVQRITNTAAALPASTVPILREIFPNALVFRMYGLTECKRVCYLEPEEIERRPDSVGKAIPGTELFILGADGEPVAPGEVGVLHVRGPHVMLGYWNRPDETALMLKSGRLPGERLLCTQDFFRMDEEGYLYFVGRSDDIIKTRGEKVSPTEVENVLYAIPGVREAAVIGVPDALLGQAIQAFVALDEGCELTDKDIKRLCAAQLEGFMVPRDVVFRSALPKTDTGKIRRKSLVESAE